MDRPPACVPARFDGGEIDLRATYRVSKEVAVALQYADSDADDPAFTDTRKAWVSLMLTP